MMRCGCPDGTHPDAPNMLGGAAERDGRTCSRGWPLAMRELNAERRRAEREKAAAAGPTPHEIAELAIAVFAAELAADLRARAEAWRSDDSTLHVTLERDIYAGAFSQIANALDAVVRRIQ